MTTNGETIVHCACGQVEILLVGKPILTTVCHCDDCQRASAELEQLPNAPRILDKAGGTAYVMQRRDRVSCTKGNTNLVDHRIEGEQSTKRVLASCCNSPMYLDFEKGHWLSLFRDRWGPLAPPVQMRVQTKYVKDPLSIPHDVPSSRSYPFAFIFGLISSKIAMDMTKKSRGNRN